MATAATDTATTVRAALPGGLWTETDMIRQVNVRAVSGDDELFVLDHAAICPAERASALLQRCVTDDIAVGSLTVGDREALLLQLRRMTLGDELDCVLRCPQASCGEQLELRFAIDTILLAPYDDVKPEYSTIFTINGHEHQVQFRPPTAADLTAAASAAEVDASVSTLLRLCVTGAYIDDRPVQVDELDATAVARVADELAARDPQAEIQLDARCATCGHQFEVLFDAGSYLLQELEARAHRLLTDVHLLALHYHWSEHDILAMPSSRRERYLDLLAAEFARQAS